MVDARRGRADQCAHEYSELVYAFNTTIMPFVDPVLLAKVRATEWVRPNDGGPIPDAVTPPTDGTNAKQ
jgi:hypothetical protein